MKVVGKTVDSTETSVTLDLFGERKLLKRVKERIQDEVGNFLVEQTLINMEKQTSPVAGAPNFAPLSKEYAKLKRRDVGNARPNLEFDGEMKDQLNFKPAPMGIEVGYFGDRAPAADGHNNLSGKSHLPLRQTLPDEGQSYKRPIQAEVDRIVADIIAEETNFKASQFKGIESSAELYRYLKDILGLQSRSEINLAVIRSDDLLDVLKEAGMYDLLKL